MLFKIGVKHDIILFKDFIYSDKPKTNSLQFVSISEHNIKYRIHPRRLIFYICRVLDIFCAKSSAAAFVFAIESKIVDSESPA